MATRKIRIELFVSDEQRAQIGELLRDHQSEPDCLFDDWQSLAETIAQTAFNERVADRKDKRYG